MQWEQQPNNMQWEQMQMAAAMQNNMMVRSGFPCKN